VIEARELVRSDLFQGLGAGLASELGAGVGRLRSINQQFDRLEGCL